MLFTLIIVYSSHMPTLRVLGVYPSRVGDRCLVKHQVSNRVSTKERGYDEVYPSDKDDFDTSYDESVLSANSPSTKEDEDSDVDGSESGSGRDSNNKENVGNVESSIRSIIGPEGLRQFLIPLMWTINDFNSTVKRPHFETLQERYQIPTNVPIHLPIKFEKCY